MCQGFYGVVIKKVKEFLGLYTGTQNKNDDANGSQKLNICFASDNNYAPLCGVAIASILKSSKPEDNLVFNILSNNISDENKEKISSLKSIRDFEIVFVDITNKDFFENLYLPEKKGYLSTSAYYRFLMSSLFPDIDKILYLDCDVIVTTSLKKLFEINLSKYYAAVVEDTDCKGNQDRLDFKESELYFNSGVLLANLAKWRKDNIQEKLFDNLKEGWDDQDILNIVLKDKLLYIDKTYNWQWKAKHYDEKTPPAIIHFITAYKPWRTGSRQSFNKEYFKALKDTPWDSFFNQYLKQFCLNIHKDRCFIHISLWGLKTRVKRKNA